MKLHNDYKVALKMAWPSVLESFFISLAGMIDMIMVGALGEAAISAVGLTAQPKFIGMAFFFAINVAVSALVARRRGEQDKQGANQVFSTAMVISLVLCVVITVVMVLLAGPLMRVVGSNADTHDWAVQYFQIIMGGLICNVVAMCINAAQRGSGNTRIAFVTNVVSSIVNVVFNFLLIEGRFGFPAWGIRGAAIATVFGSFVAMCLSIMSLFHKETLIEFRYIVASKVYFVKDAAISIVKLASNLFVENLAMRVGFLATSISAAGLGTQALAVHHAGMNFLGLGFSFGDGMQVAAVALTGRALGERNKGEAIRYGHICQRIGFAISVMLSAVLIIFGRPLMGLYFSDPTSIDLGQVVMRFAAVIVIMQISQVIYGGCLRSGGDVRFTLYTGLISVTFIRTVVTLVLVLVFNLGLVGVWLGVLSDQLSRFLLLRYRFKAQKWVDIKI